MGFNKMHFSKIVLLLFFLPAIVCSINLKAIAPEQTDIVTTSLGDPLGTKGVLVADLDNFLF